YGRTARTYLLPDTPGDQPLLREMLAEYDHEAAARLIAELVTEPPDAPICDGPVFTTYRRARIPVARAAEYSRRLNELTVEFVDEPSDGDVELGLFVWMCPTNRTVSDRRAADTGDDEEGRS